MSAIIGFLLVGAVVYGMYKGLQWVNRQQPEDDGNDKGNGA